MSVRDYSVMPVQVQGEPKAIERAVRVKGYTMAKDAIIDVEFGAVWAEVQGEQYRIAGQWRQCVVTGHEGAIVHCQFSPDPATAPPALG